MGPKKKVARSNKKKQKDKASASSSQPRIASTTDSNRQQHQQLDIDNLPTFHTDNANHSPNANTNDAKGGIYERYKKCTQNFRDWMKQVLPNHKIDTVNDLSKGVDQILDQNIKALDNSSPIVVISPSLETMESLTTSIKYREIMTENMYGNQGGDDEVGHKYMIETLKYCRDILRLSRRIARVAIKNNNTTSNANVNEQETSVKDEIGGCFNALILDDSDEEEEEGDDQFAVDEEMIRQRQFPDIAAPVEPATPYNIEDLIHGDDRFQALAFLRTMDDLMEVVDGHYGVLKTTLREHDTCTAYWLKLLMECAAVANMATETVLVMENSLAANHPHLSSFYRVLAVVFFYPSVAEIQQEIRPERLRQKPHLAKIFVGDLIECIFHNMGHERHPALVKRFVKLSGLPFNVVDRFAQEIALTTQIETQLEAERARNWRINDLGKSLGQTPHMWFRRHRRLGGDRSVLNTHIILQKVLDLVQDDTKLQGIPGYWGSMFNEGSNPARRIRGDMDELFATDIIPELIELCKRAPIRNLPNRMALIPVLDLLSDQLRNGKESPISVSLTFGCHALLTSIMVLQGDGDLARIATYSKRSYNKLFAQLQEESESSEVRNTPIFYRSVNNYKGVVNFAKPVGPPGSRTAEDNAFWNPLLGGEYLLYGTYMCSIGLGSSTVDSLGQLRLTLHLYNALRKRELIQDVPFLGDIDKVFDKTKAIWVGGRPEAGSFAKQFYMAWGMSIVEANRLASTQRRGDVPTESIKQGRNTTRKLAAILPEEYSASYRRLIQRDFSHDLDDYTIRPNTSNAVKKHYAGLFDLLSRVNMTRDSMDDDEDTVIPTNFIVVGSILNQFIRALSQHMGWEPHIRDLIAICSDNVRNSRRTTGRIPRVGGFETSDLNFEWQAMAHYVATLLGGLDHDDEDDADRRAVDLFDCKKAAMFMTAFFKISKERYTFFVEESKDK